MQQGEAEDSSSPLLLYPTATVNKKTKGTGALVVALSAFVIKTHRAQKMNHNKQEKDFFF